MNKTTDAVGKSFEKIGARLVVRHTPRAQRAFDLNIAKDKRGEHFTLAVRDDDTTFRVLQANAASRHLLLFARSESRAQQLPFTSVGERFLCGHDERHWFTAKVDEPVTTVIEAKRALLPQALKDAGLTADDLARRKTAKFVRQGEWFFLPVSAPDVLTKISAAPVHLSEPLIRSRRGKPHLTSELVRFGGTQVVLIGRQEYSEAEYGRLLQAGHIRPKDAARAQHLMKDPEVYVRGKVRHGDHGTIDLRGWHQVFPNREGASLNLSFYD